MATGTVDVIAPKELVLPTLVVADQLTTAPTGSLAISGAFLIYHNGTKWITATTTT